MWKSKKWITKWIESTGRLLGSPRMSKPKNPQRRTQRYYKGRKEKGKEKGEREGEEKRRK
jgi:hypothetical protein